MNGLPARVESRKFSWTAPGMVVGGDDRGQSIDINLAVLARQYRITTKEPANVIFSCDLSELLDEEKLEQFMDIYRPVIKALDKAVIGTYLISYCSFLCAAFQYSLWSSNSALNVGLHNVMLYITETEGKAGMEFRLKKIQVDACLHEERGAWRERILSSYYRYEVTPLIKAVSLATGVSCGQLWGQLVTRMHYAKDQWDKEAENEDRLRVISDDFHFLLSMEARLFDRSKNPFAIRFRMVDHPNYSEPLRLKASCCLAFRTDTCYGYCYTCPRLSDKDREEMKQQISKSKG